MIFELRLLIIYITGSSLDEDQLVEGGSPINGDTILAQDEKYFGMLAHLAVLAQRIVPTFGL
ncbi:MAG: hypothetical protein AVO34_05875 [Firmicutes bacterium ML8_F2]|nr:MAG: hypothetical protein AVO34_05875 [Firmicutes bacterium ML8_F2]